MAIHVALFEPQIPANTGNIARTCAGTGVKLHLIKPLGFSTEDKMLKRAGLDYWQHVDVTYHDGIRQFIDAYPEGKFYFITKFGQKSYASFDYSNSEEDIFFVFGKETKGLPDEILAEYEENCLRVPMNDNIRALNLSNTAAVLVYEALRQQSFNGLK
ncbi:tRNA (uridine(34)/cytosine(34)/5-carboxymethylaminomethyluridine(34)-2'-O)-methyltransferase TrmL [Sporosarcina pasteurii]|uniref:Putative tRNA (cytidine(34)-2'-O)-methyltransferase n=1 Tax=Sporosarcina pasteurii TaxID=1474 RepID=A0A380CAJ5_SPOPA|nr:tRNA (uridine(34)/cytosine(34)/5-carboxymethylaminomethyluridine(34)-2'-O)-methyltransferase TrmL [Sporosarcina pasteurii]MDS9472641.1 tRNA (uridine(34)/cytosine(34)/5-carboxymethylaminomethyluridine(34)-2'-O)-methyltransferase TrmL [Sporosarcina pasteurii]QBQ04303.1 tRNA (uridine(34)/cytosine(34)/5-carboxymethylaminomethyluridine(34)-2'-O)-methyltransferase TrmL [Sporosarcina pasteurii]SUJ16595.1 tRNA (cytidine(34)-2'-O)-methyltransferase [Sporosarcina pasteurii]